MRTRMSISGTHYGAIITIVRRPDIWTTEDLDATRVLIIESVLEDAERRNVICPSRAQRETQAAADAGVRSPIRVAATGDAIAFAEQYAVTHGLDLDINM